MQEHAVRRPSAGNTTQRLLYGAGIFGGTVAAINLLFNRETREDGGMPAYERGYLNETFLTTGLGIGIIGIAAKMLHQSGWSYRLIAMNPLLVMGVSLAASLGSMYGTLATSPDQ
jgi:growth hormone-inducible transmembrane protein